MKQLSIPIPKNLRISV